MQGIFFVCSCFRILLVHLWTVIIRLTADRALYVLPRYDLDTGGNGGKNGTKICSLEVVELTSFEGELKESEADKRVV